jgi:predicted RND superfamily exporter protein
MEEKTKANDEAVGGTVIQVNSETPPRSIFTDDVGNLKFVNAVVRRPCTIFALIIALTYGITTGLYYLTIGAGNPFSEGMNDYDFSDDRSIAYDSLRLAQDQVFDELNDVVTLRNADADQTRLQEDYGDVTYWIYEAKTDDGVLTKEAIPRMREAETTILDNEDYVNYCLLKYNPVNVTEAPVCKKPLSVMNIYYASTWNSAMAQEILSDLEGDKLEDYKEIALCVEYNMGCNLLTADQASRLESGRSTKNKIDSMLANWDGEGELNSDVDEVTNFIAHMNELPTRNFNVNFFLDENFSISNQVSMFSRSMIYWGELLEGTEDIKESDDKRKDFILKNLLKQWSELIKPKNNEEIKSYFFMGALIFDIIIAILVGDALKAIASLLAVFFYLRYMIGSWFLSAVGMYEIFMSLPLAWFFYSFVFQIKYFSTLNILCLFLVLAIGADDIFVFMDAYKQSASRGPEVNSSLETRMSWVFRRSGSAMFVTSLTTCSAFLATLSTPLASVKSFGVFAALVILFDFVLVMTLYCTAVVIYHDRFENKPSCCSCSFWKVDKPSPTEVALEVGEAGGIVEEDRVTRFFKEKLAPFILSGRNRLFVAVPLIAWFVLAAVFASTIKPTTTAEQFLDEDHPIQKASTIIVEEFPKTQEDETTKIHFVWGLEDVDRTGIRQLFNTESVGKPVFVDNFVFNEQCQREMLKACNRLKTDEKFEEFIILEDGLRGVDCFVEDLGAYSVDQYDCNNVNRYDLTDKDWEVPASTLTDTLTSFVRKPSCSEDSESVGEYYRDTLGWNGNELRFAGISVKSSVLSQRQVLPEDEVREHYDLFLEFGQELDKTMVDVCQSKTIVTDTEQVFITMNNQRLYRVSAFVGGGLGLLIAFVVLFLSSRKLHIAVFAILSIIAVLISVIGTITMIGFTLGVFESILISILAGFSVDYVIHLSHAYVHAKGDTDERVVAAFGDMGISVFSGMLTSVIASIPLFFCTLTFFAKFGTFLCLTISFSWIYANFGFMSLVAQFKISMSKKWI